MNESVNTIRLIERQQKLIWQAGSLLIEQRAAPETHDPAGIGIAMTYLAQALRTNLMSIVHGRSAAELAHMNQILRQREAAKTYRPYR